MTNIQHYRYYLVNRCEMFAVSIIKLWFLRKGRGNLTITQTTHFVGLHRQKRARGMIGSQRLANGLFNFDQANYSSDCLVAIFGILHILFPLLCLFF